MTVSDVLVQDYLARLQRAAAELPVDRRDELLAGIGEHLDAARDAGLADDEAAVRALLDRLGEPSDIVAAASDSSAAPAPGTPAQHPRRRGTGLELASVVLLTAGSFFLVMGWLAGVVLLWCSDRWRTGEKLLGTLLVPLGPGGVLVGGALLPVGGTTTCAGPSVPAGATGTDGGSDTVTCTSSGGLPEWLGPDGLGPVLVVALLVASVAVPVWLYRTARRRSDAEQAPALRS